MYNNIATALPHVEAGKLNGLAVGGEQRFPALANVPTVAETVPGFDVTPWVGVFVPAKTPKEVVARLSKEVEALLKDPEVVKIFQANMIKASYLDSEPFTKQIKKETDDWEKVIKTLASRRTRRNRYVQSSPQPRAAGVPRHGARFRRGRGQAGHAQGRPARPQRPHPAGRGAAQGLADGASHAGAARGSGRRRRRRADLLHRHRGTCRRRHRRRRGADRDIRARPAAVLGDDAGAARALRPAFLEDDDYHLALACREPGDDSALGINYHRPAAGDAPCHHRDPRRRSLDHQRRQGLRRQRARSPS